MFKFDFKVEEEENENDIFKTNNSKETTSFSDNVADTIEWYESQEILPNTEMLENLDVCKLNATEITIGDITLTHMVSGVLLQDINSEDITQAEQKHSDLIPGVYEGGAKIWECTDDLLHFLSTNYKPETWKNKKVLDLGCGSGLLGIYAYKSGAKVHFQDYNKDVLERITIPNVLLNVPKPPIESDLNLTRLNEDLRFYSGDWCKYAEFTRDDIKFDIILTSETIYNPQNQSKLLSTLFSKLNSNGLVLIAAKTHYFGVGGDLRQFEALISSDTRFQSKVLWTATEGVGREILEMKHL